MNCNDTKERLSAFYDAELPEAEAAEVRQHLSSCAECSRQQKAFAGLSGMVQSLPQPPLPTSGWKEMQDQLSSAEVAEPDTDSSPVQPAERRPRMSSRFRRAVMVAATVAAALFVWLGSEYWGGPSRHELMAADFAHYVENLQDNPEAAQRELLSQFNGSEIKPSVAARSVRYQPAAARTLPPDYTLESMYSLKMPCCDCLQTVCRRSDGSRIAIFEYAEEQPATYGNAQQTRMQCRDKSCCLINASEQLAVTWNDGGRQITVAGVRDQSEIETLVAWLE
tara:strand:+ start:21466 stop:22305 length:840 start_codon:yes stop_codon:yes gene_type:complete